MRRAERRTNLGLLLLLAAVVATGALNFATGTGWVRFPTVAHAVTGLGLLLLARPKWPMVRRGTRRRPAASTWPAVLLGVTVVVAIGSGALRSTGAVLAYGPVDDMQVHVGAGLAAVPLAIWHAVARRGLPARTDIGRRGLLRAGVVLGGAAAVWGVLEALPGGRRRATGSFEEASHRPEAMPSIIWLFDPVPRVDPAAWRLTVGGSPYGLDDLRAFDDRVTAVVDCTSGWWAEQDWHGVRLDRLLEVPDGARSILVRSVTGYARRFPATDAPRLLVATGYGGQPLAVRHGAPARLVAPGRRGFWWVKWLDRIEASDTPWWLQPPYPLQ